MKVDMKGHRLAFQSLKFCFILNALTIITTQSTAGATTHPTYDSMKTLQSDLLTGYDTTIRPRINQSKTVEVNMTFTIIGVTDFDVAGQKLTIMGYFLFLWTDEKLVWNPVTYDGLYLLQLPITKVWTPNVLYSKAYDGKGHIQNDRDVVTYYQTGYAAWSAEGTYKLICEVNIKFYPFDTQTCLMAVYVDDTTRAYVDLKATEETGSLESYSQNSAWKLVGIYYERQVFMEVSIVVMTIELERRADFILYTIIAPLILMSILNVGVFIVPTDSGEKGSIAVTIFLSYGVFVSMISSELPHNSINVSYLLVYILLLLVLSVVAVIYSFIQSWIYSHYGDGHVNFDMLKKFIKVSKILPGRNEDLKRDNISGDPDLNISTINLANSDKTEKHRGKRLTWKELLRKIDLVIFVVIFLVVLISTSVSFSYMSNRTPA